MRKFITAILAAGTLTGIAAPALAQSEHPWLVRGRVIGVLPDESGDLSIGGTPLVATVDIGDQYVPELDISYFFNDNVAMELILGTTPHDVSANITGVGNVDLGDVWLLPPTLTLQYHFTQFGSFKPYVGAGLNYTLFYNEDEGPVADSIDYDSSFGGALQAGFDYDMDGQPGGWLFNLDVKKVWINTEVTVDATTALSAIVNADVDINPLIVGVGFGKRF